MSLPLGFFFHTYSDGLVEVYAEGGDEIDEEENDCTRMKICLMMSIWLVFDDDEDGEILG